MTGYRERNFCEVRRPVSAGTPIIYASQVSCRNIGGVGFPDIIRDVPLHAVDDR